MSLATTTATLTAYDLGMAVLPNVVFTFELTTGGSAGQSFQSPFTKQTGTDGTLSLSLLQSSTYQMKRGDGDFVSFTTGTASTYSLPVTIGTP